MTNLVVPFLECPLRRSRCGDRRIRVVLNICKACMTEIYLHIVARMADYIPALNRPRGGGTLLAPLRPPALPFCWLACCCESSFGPPLPADDAPCFFFALFAANDLRHALRSQCALCQIVLQPTGSNVWRGL